MSGVPIYCPACGGRLDSLSRTVAFVCTDCGERTFLNLAPNARVVVVERNEGAENRLLLVEIDDSGRLSEPPYHESEWMLQGGHPEYHKQHATPRRLVESGVSALDRGPSTPHADGGS